MPTIGGKLQLQKALGSLDTQVLYQVPWVITANEGGEIAHRLKVLRWKSQLGQVLGGNSLGLSSPDAHVQKVTQMWSWGSDD